MTSEPSNGKEKFHFSPEDHKRCNFGDVAVLTKIRPLPSPGPRSEPCRFPR